MAGYSVKPLDPTTWNDFVALVERHNGIWGGCWCMSFHAEGIGRDRTPADSRALKEQRVKTGHAHAALVFDGATCIGWCQFGPTDELPRIKNRRAYQEGLKTVPDWRITCFFSDKAYRSKGVADAALGGALQEIRRLGGGTVESYPDDVAGKKMSSSFLHNGTVAMFERQGFKRDRQLGKTRWVVTKTLRAK
jgi:hypothetical protein